MPIRPRRTCGWTTPRYQVDKNLEVSGSWVMLRNVPADFDSSFAVDILAGITDIYGQKLGADQTQKLRRGSRGGIRSVP